MEFIFGPAIKNKEWNSIQVDGYYLNYNFNHNIKARELYWEDQYKILVGDVNIQFLNAIKKNNDEKEIVHNINKLTNGFIFYIDKSTQSINLYTDVFGFYHLFYIKSSTKIWLASDFKLLTNLSEKQIDNFALLDLILFNYTLFDRTLINDIKRLRGGTKFSMSNNNFSINEEYNYADNFVLPDKAKPFKIKELGDILVKNINDELCQEFNTNLTMTGGLDSRALLAGCNRLGLNFSTFTFGQKGNIEIETPKPFINKYSIAHKNYELNEAFLEQLENILEKFIYNNLDNPTILDLPQYSWIKDDLAPSNIITGFMGGEIMGGQSIGAQVTFNDFAAQLIMSKSFEEMESAFDTQVDKLSLFNKDIINSIKKDYLKSLETYSSGDSRINLLRFMFNEKYSKFFGAVNKVFKNHSNLMAPFLNTDYLDLILKSKISFLNKKPFLQNPIKNMKYKVSYAKMIKSIYPELGETKLDRLYKINDLCKYYRLPKAAMGYLNSHLFRLNKNQNLYPKPHHYDQWYREIIRDKLSVYSNPEILKELKISKDEYNHYSSPKKKKLANATAGIISINRIQNL